jgi:hypothetical protein
MNEMEAVQVTAVSYLLSRVSSNGIAGIIQLGINPITNKLYSPIVLRSECFFKMNQTLVSLQTL